MSERAETDHDHSDLVDVVPASHREHHDHSDNVDMRDLVTDTEHLQVSCDWCRAGHVTPSTSRSVDTDGVSVVTLFPQDDLGPFTLYTRSQLDSMELDQRVFLWFSAHDWDEDEALDGLELVKVRVLQF